MKLWGGRFEEATDARVADFTRSVDVDAVLALDDLAGSIAHVHGLGRAGLLAGEEVDALVAGLDGLRADVELHAPAVHDPGRSCRSRQHDGTGPAGFDSEPKRRRHLFHSGRARPPASS